MSYETSRIMHGTLINIYEIIRKVYEINRSMYEITRNIYGDRSMYGIVRNIYIYMKSLKSICFPDLVAHHPVPH